MAVQVSSFYVQDQNSSNTYVLYTLRMFIRLTESIDTSFRYDVKVTPSIDTVN